MKLGKWRVEYTVTLMAALTLVLLICPFSLKSTVQANNISRWKATYNKIAYAHDAIHKQELSDMLNGLKNAQNIEEKEERLLTIIKPYFRLSENKVLKKYKVKYMNKEKMQPSDYYFIKDYYFTDNNIIVGIKDLPNNNDGNFKFMMTFDVNGLLPPNMWGKDVFGIIFYSDKVEAIGKEMTIENQYENCSPVNTGVGCSNYYLIGGNFNE